MKKWVVIILTLLITQMVSAQKSFYSGAFVLSANYGVDGHITDQHFFNPSENSAQTLNGTVSASNYNFLAEYGLFNWLGLGLITRFDNYYMANNEITKTKPSAGAFDLGGTVNIHLLKWKHLDLLGGLDWGISHFTYNVNNDANTQESDNGSWSDIHATARFYIKRLGLNASVYVPTMSYRSIQANNAPAGDYIINYWKSTGYGASIGVQYRFF